MPEACDLCNVERDLIEGTFFKRSSSGGIVKLCDSCWNKLDRVRCSLCGTDDLPKEPKRQHNIGENNERGRGGAICDSCRSILDFNHL